MLSDKEIALLSPIVEQLSSIGVVLLFSERSDKKAIRLRFKTQPEYDTEMSDWKSHDHLRLLELVIGRVQFVLSKFKPMHRIEIPDFLKHTPNMGLHKLASMDNNQLEDFILDMWETLERYGE